MTKSKRRELRDRLSELPDALIFHILWFLPMRYVVFTSVLSSRWNSLWTTTPYLNFDFSLESHRLDPQKFISRALLSWRGIRILKFKIEFMYPYALSLGIDFDLWMRFAVEKRVEELYLHGHEFDKEKREYEVPQWLYSCSSLKELSLIGCDIQINGNGNVQWSQLKSLTIDGKSFSNCERVIDQVLCGAPQLQVLNLVVMDIDTNLTIRSSSLRKLSIENFYFYINPSTFTELRIWTPNLETLEILGDPYTKCLWMNASSLTHATLRFNELNELLYDDILGETLRQIFPAIQHVEMVSLSSLCIKFWFFLQYLHYDFIFALIMLDRDFIVHLGHAC